MGPMGWFFLGVYCGGITLILFIGAWSAEKSDPGMPPAIGVLLIALAWPALMLLDLLDLMDD